MQKITRILFVASTLTLAACGGGDKGTLAEKKAKLEKMKAEVASLEKEIEKQDTTKKEDIAKLVGTAPVTVGDFTHYIDLQGKVDADNISYITPRLGPGQVKALYVRQGQQVKKGQLLLKMDDAVVRQQITAAKQGLETIKVQLATARDLYNRQNNLFKQGIGTEVSVIQARTQVESLEKQLKTGEEQVKIGQEQSNAANVYSDVDGVADEVSVKVGEIFGSMGGGVIKIVNTSSLKVVAQVPENYAGKVNNGSKMTIALPDLNKNYPNVPVSFSSKTIDPVSRSFTIEGKLPYDGTVRPNQVAQVKIQDYFAKNAITIPVNTVGTDDKGKFVYVAEKQGAKTVAKKKQIVVGEMYGQMIEVKTGLAAGDLIVTEGFQNVYDGQALKTDNK